MANPVKQQANNTGKINHDFNNICGICYENFEHDSELVVTKECGHAWH